MRINVSLSDRLAICEVVNRSLFLGFQEMWSLHPRIQALLIHLNIFVPDGEKYKYGFGFEDAMFCWRVWVGLNESVREYLIDFEISCKSTSMDKSDFMRIADPDKRAYLLQNDWVKKEKNPGGILYVPTKKMLNLWIVLSNFIQKKEIYV